MAKDEKRDGHDEDRDEEEERDREDAKDEKDDADEDGEDEDEDEDDDDDAGEDDDDEGDADEGDDDEGNDEDDDDDDDDEEDEASSRKPTASAEPAKPDESRSSGMIWLVVAGVALLGGWWFFRGRGEEPTPSASPTPAEISPRPPPIRTAPPEPAKPAERELAIPPEPSAATAPAASTGIPEKKAAPEAIPTAQAGAGFDKLAALKAIGVNAQSAARCRMRGEPGGNAQVSVTFEPTGKIKETRLMPPFVGTATGKCIAEKINATTISAFSGEPATVIASVPLH
jgi:hypothetical protein